MRKPAPSMEYRSRVRRRSWSLILHAIFGKHQVTERPLSRAAHPPSQLVMGEPKATRISNNHGVRSGDVQSIFNDGRGNQNVSISLARKISSHCQARLPAFDHAQQKPRPRAREVKSRWRLLECLGLGCARCTPALRSISLDRPPNPRQLAGTTSVTTRRSTGGVVNVLMSRSSIMDM